MVVIKPKNYPQKQKIIFEDNCTRDNSVLELFYKDLHLLYDLKNAFENITYINDRGEYPATQDKTGNSKVRQLNFEFNSGDRITIEKVNWTKNMNFIDTVKVNIDSKRFVNWLYTKAYN